MVLQNGERRLTGVQNLRRMLADPKKLIVCPGVYDGYLARIALQEGADCLYMVRTFALCFFTFSFSKGSHRKSCALLPRCIYVLKTTEDADVDLFR